VLLPPAGLVASSLSGGRRRRALIAELVVAVLG
jgi:hypothetical protein